MVNGTKKILKQIFLNADGVCTIELFMNFTGTWMLRIMMFMGMAEWMRNANKLPWEDDYTKQKNQRY